MSDVVEKMAAHFAPPDLRDRVAAVLEKAGRTPPDATVEDLAGLVQWQEETIEGLDIFPLVGEQTLAMAENSVKDMQAGSVGIFEAVLCRP
ncbi:hypothetical protein [Capillimicrobium parvum]|uniref:Uncharacterized protein n=1 Tax=Capillimicrobium parvum TaxID=2884022 RepID=A0A9E6Y0B8_9ACTN|nr:hypothetical protein [Capillimicrobium parvum]UGS37297.1 hypothetical protein DSM104329_03712 [Capillimicrobium parvum]